MEHQKTGLLDVQSYKDTRGIALQQVGVKQVGIPLHILQRDGHTQMVAASVRMSVDLTHEDKGTHLSRFIIQLAENSKNKAFCYNLKSFLEETQQRLDSKEAHIKMDFPYFYEKKAPVSGLAAPMPYQCSFEATLVGTHYQFILGLIAPVATLCPCSKAISNYGAHNQRAEIRARMVLDTQSEHQVVWIEDLIEALDECSSCPVYPILKREDEKYVTERAYDNPKFVEDVCREAIMVLRGIPSITGFEVEVEAFESIHGHNAWAYQKENIA